jgi:uncharacterized membrane protein YgcG
MSYHKCNHSFFSSVTKEQFYQNDVISFNKYSILPYEEKMNFKKVEDEESFKSDSSSPEFDSFLSSVNNDSSPSVDFGSSTDFGGGDFGGGGASSDF